MTNQQTTETVAQRTHIALTAPNDGTSLIQHPGTEVQAELTLSNADGSKARLIVRAVLEDDRPVPRAELSR